MYEYLSVPVPTYQIAYEDRNQKDDVTAKNFTEFLNEYSRDGWEFVGNEAPLTSQVLEDGNPESTLSGRRLLVFRRPKSE